MRVTDAPSWWRSDEQPEFERVLKQWLTENAILASLSLVRRNDAKFASDNDGWLIQRLWLNHSCSCCEKRKRYLSRRNIPSCSILSLSLVTLSSTCYYPATADYCCQCFDGRKVEESELIFLTGHLRFQHSPFFFSGI